MADVDPKLRRAWREHPRTKVNLIIRVDGTLRSGIDQLEERDIEIRRRFRLTKRLAIRTTGAAAAKLAQESWVTSIEPDEPVKAL